jgi:phosphomannomutase
MLSFAITAFSEHQGGVMVTASHNPAEYNGFKMTRGDGMPVSGEEAWEVVEELEELKGLEVKEGKIITLDIAKKYLDKVFSLVKIPSLKDKKIVVDAGNGMGGAIMTKLFARLDCEMISMYFEPDGNFPNHEANPIKVETLKDLVARVKKEKADLGIALDGDADRVIFVDEKGVPINGDVMLAMLATERLRTKRNGAVVWSPNGSWAVRDAIKNNGGRSVWEKVGRTNIIKRVIKEKAVLGGEVSAHYFYPEFGGLESTDYTILLGLKMLGEAKGTFSEAVKPFRTYSSSGEINFEVKDKTKAIAAIEKKYAPEAVLTEKLDGVRMELADWWFNVRQSNTEPLIRLNLEAKSQEMMKEKVAEITALIKGLK